MKAHKYAEVFPMASEAELIEISEDISAHGLKNPIIIFEGQILDGRNRFKACAMAKVEPRFEEYTGSDPLDDVVSWNAKRRQMSASQKAEVARTLKPLYEKQAKDRQRLSRGHGVKGRANLPEVRSRTLAAEALGVSGRLVQDAELVHRRAPELSEEIRSGNLSVNAAKKKATAGEAPHKKDNEVSDAKYYVSLAIYQLDRIRDDDPHGIRELRRLVAYADNMVIELSGTEAVEERSEK